MDSCSNCAARRFDARASQYIRQHEPHPSDAVASVALWAPEQGALRTDWGPASFAQREIALESGHHSGGQRKAAVLEELRLSDVYGLLLYIDIPQFQAHNF